MVLCGDLLRRCGARGAAVRRGDRSGSRAATSLRPWAPRVQAASRLAGHELWRGEPGGAAPGDPSGADSAAGAPAARSRVPAGGGRAIPTAPAACRGPAGCVSHQRRPPPGGASYPRRGCVTPPVRGAPPGRARTGRAFRPAGGHRADTALIAQPVTPGPGFRSGAHLPRRQVPTGPARVRWTGAGEGRPAAGQQRTSGAGPPARTSIGPPRPVRRRRPDLGRVLARDLLDEIVAETTRKRYIHGFVMDVTTAGRQDPHKRRRQPERVVEVPGRQRDEVVRDRCRARPLIPAASSPVEVSRSWRRGTIRARGAPLR